VKTDNASLEIRKISPVSSKTKAEMICERNRQVLSFVRKSEGVMDNKIGKGKKMKWHQLNRMELTGPEKKADEREEEVTK